jgi:hypothetical protein
MQIELNLIEDGITEDLERIKRELTKVSPEALKQFKALTPIRGGNARRRTTLKNNETILANYPYAQRLDEGYSKQAPKGMSEPFGKWLEKKLKQILRG